MGLKIGAEKRKESRDAQKPTGSEYPPRGVGGAGYVLPARWRDRVRAALRAPAAAFRGRPVLDGFHWRWLCVAPACAFGRRF